jgi:3-polyprenyl-4-hydroxybenzoate decarboxylase
MPYQSLGEFIAAADAAGEARFIEGADLNLEVGCLTELMAERNGPLLVFDKFAGFPSGHRICANAVRSDRRFALALDLPLDVHPLELLRHWREKRQSSAPVRPVMVHDGPIFECV